jgi:hypothetical protein
MSEHPQYRMWKDRLDREHAQHQARAIRRAIREAEQASWDVAWLAYKSRVSEQRKAIPLPRWWNLPGWVVWLTRLHAPGRHG